MSLVVTGVGFLIHLYSSKYMEADPGSYRFFAYLNLFIFSMLVLILGDNLPVLFVGLGGRRPLQLPPHRLLVRRGEERGRRQEGVHHQPHRRLRPARARWACLVYYVGALDWNGIDGGARNLLQTIEVWPLAHPRARLPEREPHRPDARR